MIVGVLLAAGKATRFGGDKLLIELGQGQCIAEVACARLRPAVDRLIAVPVSLGRRGHPVGFAQCCFADLKALSGDTGARTILAKNATRVVEIPVTDAGAWHDVDTVDDLVLARQLFNTP